MVLAAHRDDHPHFGVVRSWFDDLIMNHEPFGVPNVVWLSFVRIATHRRVFKIPTPPDEAFAFLHSVRGQAGYVALRPGNGHLALFERLCRDGAATGDLVPDAYLAALAMEQGCELVSLDRDFARFPDLRWRLPASPPGG